ncbi:polysaccharide deacetylase family protein [Paenibacillus sp. WST5]|uniref:Polysaccharide deacetylase family protein n=1 Tax=Paenibacillus sedimenti TaxID=2770274 RepID=A0A926QJJ9_9BACL|nr:polysaccharide deacetylase family protein [Paenibacillus sedimenti]
MVVNFFPSLVRANDVIYSNQVSVLVYHHIDDHTEGGVTISTKLFENQLEALKRKGYQFISLDQFKQFMSKGTGIPDNAILVTFDDGYKSFYTNAYPILKKMSVPAVNFVITNKLEDPLGGQTPYLSGSEIIQMRKEYPDIDFQSHSDSMHATRDGKPMLTNKIVKDGLAETDDQFKQRVINDTKTCTRKLNELHGSQTEDAYAYPFGSYDNQTMELLMQAGVQYGFTTKNGMVTRQTDPMQIPRINAGSPYVRAKSVNNLIKQALRHQLQTIH